MGRPLCNTDMPLVPSFPDIRTRSAVLFAPKSGNIVMSPSFFDISAMTWAIVVASVIMQNVPIGRTRAIQRETHEHKSALWCALCFAGVPLKYGGFVSTRSKVRSVRHVLIFCLISSMCVEFNSALCLHAVNMSSDVSMPVIFVSGLFAR